MEYLIMLIITLIALKSGNWLVQVILLGIIVILVMINLIYLILKYKEEEKNDRKIPRIIK